MTIEITEKKEEEKKPQEADIKETLKAADEYERLKAENDKLEAEYQRQIELKAKIAIGGKAEAGKEEQTDEQKAQEEANRILSMYK